MSTRGVSFAVFALLGVALAGCNGGPLDRDGGVRPAIVAPTATLTKDASGTLVKGHFELELTSVSSVETDVWLFALQLYTLERELDGESTAILDEHAMVSPISGFPISLGSRQTRRVPLDFTAHVPASRDRPFTDEDCDGSSTFCLALSGQTYSSVLDDFADFGQYSNDRQLIALP